MRAALAAILLLLAAPSAAAAQSPWERVFTLAGGGTEAPRDGLPATQADLGNGTLNGLAALPDGSIAVLTGDGVALAVGTDGRLRMLPRPRRSARGLTAGPDGSLYAVTFRQLLRLPPGGGAWVKAYDLTQLRRRRPGLVEVRSLAVLPDGFVLALGGGRLVRLDAAGAVRDVPVPDGFVPWNVLPLPDGGFAYVAVDDFVQTEELVVAVPPDGPARTLSPGPEEIRTQDVAALPGGAFARTGEGLEVLDGAWRVTARMGRRPGLGLGDGGPPARALLERGNRLAALADGSLVVEDLVARSDASLDAYAYRLRGTTLLATPPEGPGAAAVLRVLVPPGAARPVAAVAPSTFATLAEGRVGYVTTIAGRATVEVRRRGRVVARAEADVAAGAGELALPGAPPRGDLRVTLSIAGAGGETAGAHLGVATARRLTRGRARRLVRVSGGSELGAGRCVRAGALRVRCAMRTRPRGRCFGVLDVRLRPDGARGVLVDPAWAGRSRACRALVRRP